MRKEHEDRPVTRYEELCAEIYRDLGDRVGTSQMAEGETLYVSGWMDPRTINHGYSRSAYGYSLQTIGASHDPKQGFVQVRSIRIEIVSDYYHYKDTRFHYIARELMPKKSIFGKTIYEWVEIPENVAHVRDNWLTQLREKIKSCKRN